MKSVLRILAWTHPLTLSMLVFGAMHYQIPAKFLRVIESAPAQTQPAEANPFYQPARDLFELYAPAGQSVIVGDSHVAHVAWSELLPEWSLAGRGIRGDTTRGLRARLSDLHAYTRVMVWIGTNDVLRGERADEIAGRIVDIAARLRDGDLAADVSVISVPPVAEWITRSAAMNRTVQSVNRQLRDAAQRGAFRYIDLHSRLTAHGGSLSASKTTDGIHLNARGYRILRDQLRADLRR